MQKRTQKPAPKSRAGLLGPTWRHIVPLGADSGAMVGISGPTVGAMLHLNGQTWSDAGPLATAWVPTWTPYWTPWGQLEGHVAKVPHLPAKTRSPVARVPRLPHKKENKNEQQRAVLGSWGQRGRHIGPLAADLGAMLGISGFTWGPCCTSRAGLWAGLGAMLDLVGAT